jgi:hypothetical protein
MTDERGDAPPPTPDEHDAVRNDTPSPPKAVHNETNGAVDVDAAHDRAS